MTDEKSPDEEIEQALQKSVEKVEQLALTIRDTSVGNEDVWYRNLLLGILNSALLDFRYLKIGEKQHSPYLAAWNCRNLLELKVIAAYVLASADNAKTFKNDFVVDAKEFYEAISKRHRATHPKLIERGRLVCRSLKAMSGAHWRPGCNVRSSAVRRLRRPMRRPKHTGN